jgi:uncharacterized protein YbjQ (UPF0145 family)
MSTSKKEKESKSQVPPELLRDVPSCFTDTHGVITSTMNDIPGYRVVRVLGAIYGLTVRSRNWGADLGAFVRSAVGGEIRIFTNVMYSARNDAAERLVGECMQRGGNAIIALRFDVGALGAWTQVCAYGTACIVEKIE